MCFQGLLFLESLLFYPVFSERSAWGFLGVSLVWFCLLSSMILLYWSSDQHRHVLVTFISRNSCFWMGWFTTAASIRKSQNIVPLHCANNSDVPFCWLATLLLVGASEGIAARAGRISAFSLSPKDLFSCSFISHSMTLSPSFSLKWQRIFTLLSTTSDLELWKGKDGAIFGGEKKP